MDEKNIVLEAMRKAGEPLNAGKIAELTGLDRKVVDKAMAALKKRRSHRLSGPLQVDPRLTRISY